jgi:hypothetical protein
VVGKGRRIKVSGWPGQKVRPYLKNTFKAKKAGNMVQAVEHLPTKMEGSKFKLQCQQKKEVDFQIVWLGC